MLCIVPLLLLIPNVCLDVTELHYTGLERAINILLPLGVYLLVCSFIRRIGIATLCLLPIMILCAFQIVLLFLYGESIIAIDMFLNVATTNVHEASELLSNLSVAIVVVCLVYLPPIIIAIILIINKVDTTERPRRMARLCGTALIVAGAACWLCADDYNASRRLFPVNVISNMVDAFKRTEMSDSYFETSDSFRFHSMRCDNDTAGIYVMIIGETSRADNWQLGGYKRPTNPELSKHKNLVYFTKAMSESNTTHKSVPLLMSHLESCTFADSIYYSKGIIDAFREAGFTTAWLSNQQRNGALIDFFGEQADTVKFITDDGALHYDTDLCPLLGEFITKNHGKPLLIVLHTYGSHFNYHERYPAEFNRFSPDNSAEAKASNRQGLINAYDNAILYTDTFIDSVIEILSSSNRPSAMIYLADHGEDIFDDERERFLHASPTPTYWQLHVPMLAWVSESYKSENPDALTCMSTNADRDVSSSRSAFHTMVSLAGITTPYYDASADLSSLAYTAPTRVFLDDYNEATPLSTSGMRESDFNQLLAHNINWGDAKDE